MPESLNASIRGAASLRWWDPAAAQIESADGRGDSGAPYRSRRGGDVLRSSSWNRASIPLKPSNSRSQKRPALPTTGCLQRSRPIPGKLPGVVWLQRQGGTHPSSRRSIRGTLHRVRFARSRSIHRNGGAGRHLPDRRMMVLLALRADFSTAHFTTVHLPI